jgi:hypothetical protein
MVPVRMPETTPFEISLVHELGQDSIRMANDWFFKWHSINIPNGVVDVEDFYGGRISVGGIVFQGQIQDIYWSSVGNYPPDLRRSVLDALERSLNGYIARVMQTAVRTDQALRGHGDPASVPTYNSSGTHSRANVEVVRLKAAHLALIPTAKPAGRPSLLKRTEEHFTKWRGVYAGVSLLMAVIGLVIKFFL